MSPQTLVATPDPEPTPQPALTPTPVGLVTVEIHYLTGPLFEHLMTALSVAVRVERWSSRVTVNGGAIEVEFFEHP